MARIANWFLVQIINQVYTWLFPGKFKLGVVKVGR